MRAESATIWLALLATATSCGHRAPPPPPAAVATAPVEAPAQPPADTHSPGSNEILLRLPIERFTAVELVCPDGYRERAQARIDTERLYSWARFKGVRASGCTAWFKGGEPVRWSPLGPGEGLTCDVVGTTAICGSLASAIAQSEDPSSLVPGAQELIVRMISPAGDHAIELSCPGGKRDWQPITGGVVRFTEVPAGDCRLSFEGERPATFSPARRGMRLGCEITTAGAACGVEHRQEVATTSAAAQQLPTIAVPQDGVAIQIASTEGELSAVELVCEQADFRARTTLTAGVARFVSVPEGSCDLFFKGSQPAKFGEVRRGTSYVCSLIGTTAVCQDTTHH